MSYNLAYFKRRLIALLARFMARNTVYVDDMSSTARARRLHASMRCFYADEIAISDTRREAHATPMMMGVLRADLRRMSFIIPRFRAFCHTVAHLLYYGQR